MEVTATALFNIGNGNRPRRLATKSIPTPMCKKTTCQRLYVYHYCISHFATGAAMARSQA
jgi:hypothetical protein